MPGIKVVGDERVTTAAETEAEEDTDSNLSLDEIESTEDSSAPIEAPIDERTGDVRIATGRFLLAEKIFSGEEKILSVSGVEKVSVEGGQGRDLESKFEGVAEPDQTGVKADVKEVLTTMRDEISSILDVTELKDISREEVQDESIPVTKKDTERRTSESVTADRKIEEVPAAKPDDKSAIRSPSKQIGQVDSKEDRASVEDAKVDRTKVRDAEMGKRRSKDGAPSISERHAAKKETPGSPVKKKTKPERPKAASPMARKRDEESEGRAIQSRRRSRRNLDDDPERQKKRDVGSQKQSRKEEEPERKQALPRTKLKVDTKRATVPAKTGEIDMSKTRSKYMAWYDKKREEAEKRKLEKKTAEDEEQLPRWVSRGLRRGQPTKPKGKLGAEQEMTPEMTPRTRRKIKPLVNVESEQLKAIVRQGRQLRRAEGIIKEDPPIQIFARTPPVSMSDTQQHRLLQHSEYKYEKIPAPFYLHPPPAPHPSPQLSPERSFEPQPSTSQCRQAEEELCTEILPLQAGGRLRHQQLLEKKSVFDIAYSEAAPSQLRSDSATPPS
ncbi:PREDICTED: eukaryotic translation initiation factor 5B-like [Dinoponera quadriceps]|uniref:Eukaryotic translation initiation factor 5B-like n=1 Tax=Dinoponera quadriceps TaxID=609295 RepID=A0A6P3XAL9_DINQU|nr:PREDICTED: eukaryotic translation initiation factor 5B-like [Dinoponera quadriceps]